jgi:hypothetical protein
MPLTSSRIRALICQRLRSERRIGMNGSKRYTNEKLIDSIWSTFRSCNREHSIRDLSSLKAS